MNDSDKYDELGELFRQKLETHRMLVDGNDWYEIERRLNKPKNKAAVWLLRNGAVAAAATIAAFLIVSRLTSDETAVIDVSLQAALEETQKIVPAETAEIKRIDILKPADNPFNGTLAVFQVPDNYAEELNIDAAEPVAQWEWETDEKETRETTVKILVAEAEPDWEMPQLAVLLPEENTAAKRESRWLFAASFGMNGSHSDSFDNQPVPAPASKPFGSKSSGNEYANTMAYNIRSFDFMSKSDFRNITHNPPLSLGITARKSLGKNAGIESGLIYTYLSSRFEWTEWGTDYDANQSLHYIGIPVNMVAYLWNSNPNWRIYLSGGFTVEKGLRAVYSQGEQRGNEIYNTTVKKSSIDGFQWLLNSSMGINYRLEKRWGIYFEPRVGYSFDNNQPISIRTEYPVYFGINLGLNYEL